MTTELLHGDVTERIRTCYYEVLNELGTGFLEDVCQAAMVVALRQAGLDVKQRVPLTVWFRGAPIARFYADIIVNNVVLVELKTGPAIEPRHEAQTLNYLRASDIEVAMVLLFGPQARAKRLIYTADRKQRQVEGLPPAATPESSM
jgi:GxxExxY protein